MKKRNQNILAIIASVLLAQLAGAIGSFFTFSAIPTWYSYLDKPSFSPPNWIFGPVWTLLYTLMGVAAWLIWRQRKSTGTQQALWLYVSHLVVNSLWSIIFFGWQRPDIAFMVIIILWTMIASMMILFARISRSAAWLLLPYLAWVSFATVLNYAIWQLN